MEKKPVFNDESGKRFEKIKTVFYVTLGSLLVFLAVAFSTVWLGPIDRLSKHNDDSVLDVIDKISIQIKDKIILYGDGTFLKIEKNSKNYSINRYGQTESKKIVLTFDDGPYPGYTNRIVDILKAEKVPATFFMIGDNVYRFPQIAKNVAASGMEIGNHTFSHKDVDFVGINKNKNTARMDFELNFTQAVITSTIGEKISLFRNPFLGTEDDISLNSLETTAFAIDRGYTVSAPTLDSSDWTGISPGQIIDNSKLHTGGAIVLLLHDGGGNRENTVLALKGIIDYYRGQGYQFTTLSDLSGLRFAVTPNLWENITANASVWTYAFVKNIPFYLNPIFIFGLIFSLGYASLTIFLSFLEVLRSVNRKRKFRADYHPSVTVLIPAYNEARVIDKTLKSVLAADYQDLKVIVIDDGSSDRTGDCVSRFLSDKRLKLYRIKNGGKFAALNFGLSKIKTEIYVSIDADTQILPDTISKIIRLFVNKNTGAVGGNVRVGNRKNIWGVLQSIEYTNSLNLERNAFSLFNSILVVPGALGAWRTQAVKEVGGYWGETLTEDAELTIRMLKHGYKLHYDKDAIAFTEAPQNMANLIKQRFRWTYGILQTFFLHRGMLFKPKNGVLGMFIMPFTVFVQIPLMLLTPLMDILAITYLFLVSFDTVAIYMGIYIVIRSMLGLLAYLIGRENPWPLLFTPFIRFIYQPVLYIALYLALFKVFQGKRVSWHKLVRYNSVSLGKNHGNEIFASEV